MSLKKKIVLIISSVLILIIFFVNQNPSSRVASISAQSSPGAMPVPVLVLKYFPDLNNDGRIDYETAGTNEYVSVVRSNVGKRNNYLIEALELGSHFHGYKNTNSPPSLDYSIYEEKEFLTPIPVLPNLIPSPPDHRAVLNNLGICNYIDNLGVKEVWIWMYHTSQVYPVESYQRGPAGGVGNGYMDLPLCNKTYTVYDYNFTRGMDMALEDHTHHLERIFAYIDYHLYWDLFTAGSTEFLQNNKSDYYNNPSAVYRCGWTHCPPNVIVANCTGDENTRLNRCTCLGYDWYNERSVLSDCQNWQPEGNGSLENVNCATWKDVYLNPERTYVSDKLCPYDDGGAAFKVWWMQNIPGYNNQLIFQKKCLQNWWEFVGDFDTAIQKGRSLYDLTQTGDYNCNTKIDIFDFSYLISKIGTTDALADLNNSLSVDIYDFRLFLGNFLKAR